MCVIAVATKKIISLKTLRECEAYNSHGGGVAWAEGGKVHYMKGVKSGKIHEVLKNVPLPHVVHFRWATVGSVQKEYCHPFVIKKSVPNFTKGSTNESVLFHNGTIDGIEFYAYLAGAKAPEGWSDSKLAAKLVAIRGPKILSQVSAWSRTDGFPNKFAVMKKTGSVKLYGEYKEKNGVLFSNMRWVSGVRSGITLTSKSGRVGSTNVAKYQQEWWKTDTDESEALDRLTAKDTAARLRAMD